MSHLILNIETSSTNCSVALSKKDKVIQLLEDRSNNYSHGEQLHVFISDILKKESITPQDLSAVAISEGPGSYTGLRIGTAAAKGLCHACNLPLIGVSTLEAMAHLIENTKYGIIIPTLDARRQDIYYAILNQDYTILANNLSGTVSSKLFEPYKDQPLYFIGPGAQKSQDILKDNHLNASFFHGPEYLPTAKTMANLAFKCLKKQDFKTFDSFEPVYLRVP